MSTLKFANKASLCLLLGLCAGLASCVNPQQVEFLERDQRRLRADLTTLQADIDAVRTTLADTRANIQQMQRDLGAIKERVDETRVQVGRQIGQTSREGDQRVKTLESRLAKLEEDAKTQAELVRKRDDELKQLRESTQAAQDAQAAALAAQKLNADGAADIALGESETIRRDYETGWRAFERKDYKGALVRFRDFLRKNPKSRLAASAQYWIGESHFAQREFDRAIVEFDEVRRKYAQSDKVPAALLRQGAAFTELGEKLNARLVLQELVEKYPQSAEAARAKQRLKALES